MSDEFESDFEFELIQPHEGVPVTGPLRRWWNGHRPRRGALRRWWIWRTGCRKHGHPGPWQSINGHPQPCIHCWRY